MRTENKNISIAILGAGMSGICMGVQLRAQGYQNFTIFEKADNVGGTWRENTYPGVSCDVPSHLYSYSFARNPDWSRAYSGGAEIQSYCEKIAADYGVTAHCHFGVTVSEAQYKDGQWHLSFAEATAPDIQNQFDVVVTAIGGLHTPAFPDIAGREDFQGAHFHTAQWNHDIDLTGKKVIIIGSAASAVQVVPQIADRLGELKVFQRTPNWMFPRINNKISGFAKSLMRAIPALSWIRRQLIYWRTEYLFHPAFKDKSFMQKYMRRLAMKYLKATVKDADLRKKLTPDFPLGCKRILFVEGYLEALQKPNVSLHTQGIEKITHNGVQDKNGTLHEADVIIYATGFEPFNFLDHLSVTNESGVSLKQAWAERISSHRTVAVTGFPNFFMLLGPNSGLGHSSIIVMIEAQVHYIMQCLEVISRKGLRRFMPRQNHQQAFNDRLQDGLKGTVWNGNCASWYKGGQFGDTQENHTIWPFPSRDYIQEMSQLELSEYEHESNSSD